MSVKIDTAITPEVRYFAPTQWRAIFAGFKKISVQIRANKVPILAGTDWSSFLNEKGAQPGRCLHDELALLVEAGFTPTEVLRAATLNPANAQSRTTDEIEEQISHSLTALQMPEGSSAAHLQQTFKWLALRRGLWSACSRESRGWREEW